MREEFSPRWEENSGEISEKKPGRMLVQMGKIDEMQVAFENREKNSEEAECSVHVW
mgnify:CR=1 FL=1